MKQHFSMFAGYNRWANQRLYDAAAKVPDERYRANLGAFFGSLHGTLNHLVVTDRIWFRRITGEGPIHTRLDDIPYDDIVSLRRAREAEDQRIIAFVDSLDDAALAGTFSYRTIANPSDITQPIASALAHVFNHQTHHRGQAHAMLTIIGGRDAGPVLDLIAYQRETGIGLAKP